MTQEVLERKMGRTGPAEAFEHILNPTDFSAEAVGAFAHALRLAVAARGHFTLIHASRDGNQAGNEWGKFPKVRGLLAKWGMLEDGASEDAVFDTLGVQVMKADLGHPNPALGIAKYVGLHACDLIVLGTHARDGLDLWFSGSIAQDLAREVRTPSLFIPNEGRGFVSADTGAVTLRNVLIPVDHEPNPARAVALASALAEMLGQADVVFHILHVGEDAPVAILPATARVERITQAGPVVETIVGAAERCNADLIVMATEGRNGFLDVLRGTVTEQVVRQAGRPVLAVPA